jgi:heparan-alpha-glucosaminide N-acetyltransferase
MTRTEAAVSPMPESPPPLPVDAVGSAKAPPPLPPSRVGSIDAYRGLVMFLMMAEVLRLRAVAEKVPGDLWAFLSFHQQHAEWTSTWKDCSLHDLIQPSFSFLVGVALPFSMASRLARGQSKAGMTAHALWRGLLLVALGVFLRSKGSDQTNFTFEDTLSQIGLGYPFLFVLGFFSVRLQWIALALILLGDWAAFALYPAPGPDFNYGAVGVPADWAHHPTGFAAHWDKNSNLAWAFDTWLLNRFPRAKPFAANGGGYATLSFIPTLGTMILGLLAGGILRRPGSGWSKVLWFSAAGVIGLLAGWGLGELGVCPVVKRIWTPTWVLFSGGWCFLFLAAFYAIIDLLGIRFWAFPLRVIGMNSIAAYCMAGLFEGFFGKNLYTHLGPRPFQVLGEPYEPLLHGAAVLLILWLILFWMYRRKIFLRI